MRPNAGLGAREKIGALFLGVFLLLTITACSVLSDGPSGTTPVFEDSSTTIASSEDSPTNSRQATAGGGRESTEVAPAEPPPPLVGKDWTRDQIISFLKWCVEEEGFAVSVSETGALEWRGPEEQREAAYAAFDRCEAQLPLSVRTYDPPTEEDLKAWYATFLQVAVCLEEEGYEVPPPPPSLDSFIDSGGGNWHPYDAIVADPNLPLEEWVRLNAVCPQGGDEGGSA